MAGRTGRTLADSFTSDTALATLTELDLRFAQSRRRAASRRAREPKSPPGRRTARSVGLAAALFVATAAFAGVQIPAEASPPPSMHAGAKRPFAGPRCPVPSRFRAAFTAASRRTGLPLSLLVAVAYEESRMDPAARSAAGAQGLLQLMPETARALEADPFVPAANVLAGARYLRRLLGRFGRLDLALAAYNAGPTAVANEGGAPTLQTLTYVANVEARAAALSGCI